MASPEKKHVGAFTIHKCHNKAVRQLQLTFLFPLGVETGVTGVGGAIVGAVSVDPTDGGASIES